MDSIDLAAAAAAGILVANTPDYGTEAVAVHTLALVLAGIRRLPMAERGSAGVIGVSPSCARSGYPVR